MTSNHPPERPLGVSEAELDLLLAGDTTPDEELRLRARVGDASWIRIETLRHTIKETSRSERDIDALLRRFYERIETTVPKPSVRPRIMPSSRVAWRRWSGMAVASACLLALGWWTGVLRAPTWGRAYSVTYTTYATLPGQRAIITLPDGSTVALNVASRMEVPTNYGTGNYVARLISGEALFTIQHHDRTPFMVVAGTDTTRVLGTQFLVRRYATDTAALVAVNGGRVAVRGAVVDAHRAIVLPRAGHAYLRPAEPDEFAFASGVLSLPMMSVRDAIPILNRWYDADIRLGDSTLAHQRFEGRFVAGSLSDLSAILRATLDVRVVRTGRVITLFPNTP